MLKKPLRTELMIKVPFYDVDQMKVVWHGNYIKYFERARCELLGMFNYGYTEMAKSGYSWPVVDLRVKYIKSALFDHTIRVAAELVEFENRIKIEYMIYDQQSGERLNKAHSTQVAVDMATGEMQFVAPPIVAERLQCHGFL